MGLIKALVIGMAGLIVAVVAVIGWGLTHHWTGLIHGGGKAESAAATAAPAAPISGPSDPASAPSLTNTMPAPPGMHFEQMATTADGIVLRFSGPEGERIVVVDPHTGQARAAITITEPAGGK
jgi:hypothetical protein